MNLNEDTFNVWAAKHYDMRRAVSIEEFNDDIKRFQYLKRLFRRYEDQNDLKVRLILNHLIILYNCLGPAATPMLFMKLEGYHKYLKPFVIMLNYMPDTIEYGEKKIESSVIPMDELIVRELREL